MNYSENEINFICRLLGYGKLPGYDDFPILSKKESEEVVEQFIEKKIIEGDKLTDKGLSLSQFMKWYAQARRYLKIGNSMFANYQNNEYVMMTKHDTAFTILPVNQDEIVAILLSKFSNQMKSVESGKMQKRFITKRRFKDYMDANPEVNAIYYYYIDLDKKTDTKGLLFYADNKLQHYDGSLEELTIYPKECVQQGIESIFCKGVV